MTGRNATLPADNFRQGAALVGNFAAELAKKWWVLLIRGILLIILGVLGFVSPSTWVVFIGSYMLVDGMALLIAGVSDQPAGQSRWPLIFGGVLGLIAGLFILWNPGVAGLTITYIIAAWAIVVGILEVVSGIALRNDLDSEWRLILTGIVSVIFGILVFRNVLAGFLSIAWIFAIFAIVAGILSVALSFTVRDVGKRIGAVT